MQAGLKPFRALYTIKGCKKSIVIKKGSECSSAKYAPFLALVSSLAAEF